MQYSQNIQPLHSVNSQEKFNSLVESMESDGWVGLPIVVRADEDGNLVGINGSHRVAAAKKAGVEVPYIWVDNQEYIAAAEQFGGVDQLCDEDRLMILETMGATTAVEILKQEIANNG